MFKVLPFLFLLTSFLMANTAFKLNITTGENGGTYYKFGQEIKAALKGSVKINNIETKGTIENLVGLLEGKYDGFIMVQDDVLNYIKVNKRNSLKLLKKFKKNITPDNLENMIKGIKTIFPLYTEEVHVLVKKDSGIKKISDLNNKKINVGAKLSGSRLTGAIILSIAKIKAKKTHFNNKEAIDKLLAGELDAVILVGGAPLEFLQKLPKNTNLNLLSIQSKNLDGYYYNSIIKKSDYPWLDDNIKTYSTRSILITTASTTSIDCASKRMVVEGLLKKLKKLKDYGHEKWEQVDPSGEIKGWDREKCIVPALDEWIKLKAEKKKLLKGFKEGKNK